MAKYNSSKMHAGRTRPGTQSEQPVQMTKLKHGEHHGLLDGPKMGTKVQRVHRSKASHSMSKMR